MREHRIRMDVWAVMISHSSSVLFSRRMLVAACLAVSVAGLSGCILAAAGAGAGAIAYVRGDLDANLDSTYDKAVEASRKALADLEFIRISENKDALKAVLVSRTAMDKKVEITISNSANRLTNIKIRVGIFGDEQVSRTILEKIRARL
jgi:hypothetical protein